MDKVIFLEYSKKNREDFLNILSNIKENNIEFISSGESSFYLKNIYNEYTSYLHQLHQNYIDEYNIEISFDDIIYDFIDSMTPQINDKDLFTRNEISNHICCVEYNMIINIHKFSYELFSINHNLNEIDFFHGDSCSYLLEKGETTIEKFRNESYYDIDNFNHIDLNNDIDYLENSTMIDIYMLSILSDICVKEEYDNVFNIMYMLNNKKLLSKSLYRYLITVEDVLKNKVSHIKGLLNTFLVVIIILTIGIFIAVKILS